MKKNNFMSEGEMVVRIALQLLETVRRLAEAYEQLVNRPPVVTNNYYYGSYIENHGSTTHNDPVVSKTDSFVPQNIELIEKLKPIFYNNEEDVRLFLKEIVGMKHKDITDLVNKWVQNRRISDYGNSRKGELWRILEQAGLYTRSRQNWNRRVF